MAVLASLVALACVANTRAELAPEASLRTSIDAATAELAARGRANDMAAVASLYADDAVLLGPDGFRVQGRAAIDDYWRQLTGAVADWQLETFEAHGNRDIAHQLGRSKLYLRESGGETQLSEVLFCVLWRKQPDGAWKIVVDSYWPPRK